MYFISRKSSYHHRRNKPIVGGPLRRILICPVVRLNGGHCPPYGLMPIIVGGCGDDKSTEPLGYAKLIVGSWEWVYVVDRDEIDYMDEDQLFWVFTAAGKYCDPEIDHDSTYYVSCRGSYTITPTLLTIDCPSGTHVEVDYLFAPQGDTLYCGRLLDAEIALKRVDDPPEYGGCN